MTMLRNTFEGGTPDGPITTQNSGGASGDAFTAVGASQVYSSAQKHEGALSGVAPSLPDVCMWTFPAEKNLALRGYFYLKGSNSGGNSDLFSVFGGPSTGIATLRITPSGLLRLYQGATTNFVWSPDLTVPAGQWVRAEMLVEQGTTTTNGRLRAAVYLGDSPTPLADSGWISGLNLYAGTVVPDRVRLASFQPVLAPSYMDTLALNTGIDYTGFIGASSPELATPEVTVIGKTEPTTVGGSNGSVTVAWPAVPGAVRYQSCLRPGSVSSGFVADDTNATSPKTYTGLAAGTYTVAVRAMVS